jgi:Ca-activated chloride channel family protein
MKKVSVITCIVFIFLFGPFGLHPKNKSATIEGVVVLEDGSLIPGVTVTLTGSPKGVKTTITDEKGVYRFSNLPAGIYSLKFELEGFKSTELINIPLEPSQLFDLQVMMSTSTLREEVVINYKSPSPDVRYSGLSIKITPETFKKLPPTSSNRTAVNGHNTEEYDRIYENQFKDTMNHPLSTFSIDVDTASYANVRRFLNDHQLPPKDAVRTEEFINYFEYDYPSPDSKIPFSLSSEVSICPWNKKHLLVHLGVQGKKIEVKERGPSNFVFLLDVSGSMDDPSKLPLLKSAFKLLVNQLNQQDRIAIVVYAGSAGLVLPSTTGDQKALIIGALDRLEAGGSTAGGEGIRLAYQIAEEHLLKEGNNRVILATDGDFNVGISDTAELVRFIEKKRKSGVELTTLGFGSGNYKDSRLEQLANKGNGNYFYIDSILEANKVLVKELGSTFFTIAKDVKIQVEFNPLKVKAYKLVGYENRLLEDEDFSDDTKDAGELGAGHSVTVMYEIVSTDSEETIRSREPLKYQKQKISSHAHKSKDLMTVKLRYKNPKGKRSKRTEFTVADNILPLKKTSNNFRFAAAVAQWSLLLRDSEFKGEASYENTLKLAKNAKGTDAFGYRAEFLRLVQQSSLLQTDRN